MYRAALLIISICSVGIIQCSWSQEELPPPELGVTNVEGAKENVRETDRVPASVVEIDFDAGNGNQITDAGDVSRYQPGISIPFDISGSDPFVPYGRNGFTTYKIRGIGGNRILLTIDGIRQPPEFQQSGGMGRTFFDPRVYGGVSILKGPGSAQYGSEALGGAIQFRSKSLTEELEYSPRPWLLKGSTTLKSVDQSFNGVLNAGARGGDMYIAASDSYTTGHEIENAKGDVDANPLDFEQNHFLGTISWIPSAENRVWITGEDFVYRGDTRLHSAERGNVFYVASQNTNERARVSIDFANTPESGFWDNMALKAYVQQADNRSLNHRDSLVIEPIEDLPPWLPPAFTTSLVQRVDQIGFKHEIMGINGSVEHLFDQGNWDHRLVYGFELGLEHGENSFNRTEVSNGLPSDPDDPNGFDPSDLYRAEVFIEDALSRGRWNVVGGVRLAGYAIKPGNDPDYLDLIGVDHVSDYHNFSVNPSVAADYLLSRNLMLWGRYAHNVRNPSLEEYVGYFDHGDFKRLPNPNLKPETADGFELGIKGGSALSYHTSLFYTFYRDFIENVTTNRTQFPDNVGDVDIYGIEAGLDWWIGNSWDVLSGFSTGIRAVWSEGKNRTTDDGVNSVDPFETVLYLAYDHTSGKWGSRLSGIYRAEKNDVSRDWNYHIPPASFVVDWSAYWNITKRISVETTIRNLTDQKYWLWPNAGQPDHSFNENPELAVQPGINGVLTLNIAL